ncbi:hypothetical protein HZH68_000269 [Vespula germanica]|uniref:Uncharacterized protein n=1 Tax=Vespula germanica TaxID=30212 RepID=A0A834U5P3_VESGE|nr:hypothetical protein HZH68_000269 [Vespula germanica]
MEVLIVKGIEELIVLGREGGTDGQERVFPFDKSPRVSPSMIKFALTIMTILVVASKVAEFATIESNQWNSLNWKFLERRTRAIDPVDAVIIELLRKISTGQSDPRDDVALVERIKEVIITTAAKIRTSSGSIEGAARRAQYLVSELTSAYTSAIYKSKNIDEARRNFARFQYTVQNIVDFTKSGRFVAA